MQKVLKSKKHITGYSVQYWLYAILNKEYGEKVSLCRSCLHDKYDVNRHDFTATGMPVKEVAKFLKNSLEVSGYKKDVSWNDDETLPNGDSSLRMINTYSYPNKDVNVHVILNKTISPNEINLFIFVYKKWHK